MLSHPVNLTHVVVVGAGPYGLSVAAHLRHGQIPCRIFGRPMQFWATGMPTGMHLKSDGAASNLSSGGQSFTLAEFCSETGRPYSDRLKPVALEHFVAYGEEFARRFVPNLEPEQIKSIDRQEGHFRITTASGERFFARQVVLATGLSQMQHIPPEFRHLPPSRLTHPSQHCDYQEFAGREVTVLGSGASSLNAAVLLHEAGARVTLMARARKLNLDRPDADRKQPWVQRTFHPSTPLGPGFRASLPCLWPDLYRNLPAALQRGMSSNHQRRSGDKALNGRMQGFPTLLGCRIHAVEAANGSGDRLRLTLTDRQGQPRQHLTSHLIAGTGYRFDKDRLRLLSQSLREQIRVGGTGAPKLNRNFESSVPGLHFVGPLAAPSFGPLLHTVAGTQFAAGRLARKLQRSLAHERVQAEQQLAVGVLARHERVL